MNIDHFVIHHIQKDQHRDPKVQTRPDEPSLRDGKGKLTEQGELIHNFVENASKMFDRQRSGKVFADIDKENANHFAEALDRYLNRKTTFIDFSTRLAQELTNTMKNVSLATGGYMAIADYTASPRKMLIVMIKQEEGFAVDPISLELRQSIHLDLSSINVGVLIDLEGYQSNTERHLAMVRGLKEIAKYFREFLGVTNYKSSKDETEELKEVLDGYMRQNRHQFPDDKIAEIKRNVANLIVVNKDQDLSLMAIAGIVNPGDPSDFHDYANNAGVSAELRGDPAVVKGWLRFRYTDKRLTLDFDKGLLDEVIRYYPAEDQLVVKVSAFPSLSTKLEQADS